MKRDADSPNIAIIGGGLSGVCAGIKLKKQLGLESFTIFDENEDFGGAWLVNKFPGLTCDVPSILYCFSFEHNPNSSKYFAPQAEVHAYITRVAKKHGLYTRARFSTRVNCLKWLEEDGKWQVEIFDKRSKTTSITKFDYTVWAVGAQRTPSIPAEFTAFKGRLIHSAEWDPAINLKGKRVGIVGSGASAIQLLPSIAADVKELHSYQRSAAWIFPRVQFNYPKLILFLFKVIPGLLWLLRILLFFYHELAYNCFSTGSRWNTFAAEQARKYVKREVVGEETLKKLLPDYPLGCKRVSIHDTYYRMFNLPHVHLHRAKVVGIEDKTIRTADGSTQELDILILATGFKVQDFFAPLQVRGRAKLELLPKWKKEGPSTFYGVMTRDAPNSFMIAGAHSLLFHNSYIFMIECQSDFLVRVIEEAIRRGAKFVAVKRAAEDQWMDEMRRNMATRVFQAGSCTSWSRDAEGRVTAIWPKNCISFFKETRRPDFSKMDWTF